MAVDCVCQSAITSANNIQDFLSLWESCPALKEVFIPNLREWEDALASLKHDSSGHGSILLLAFQRGYLHRLTLPVHKFVLDGSVPSPTLRTQYAQDLQERWFIRPEALWRHKRSKSYLGRLAELLVIEWASKTRRIIALEATGGDHDIVTRASNNIPEAIEVKFIGTEDSDFKNLMTMKIFGGARDLTTAADFLLSRIYEAAKQLASFPDRRTAIIVIDEFFAWNDFGAAIAFGTFDLSKPTFQSTNPVWLKFLDKLKDDYPEIESDLASTVLSLNQIRIFRLIADETLKEEVVVNI